MTNRIETHKILGNINLNMVPFYWNNQKLYGNKGESLTAALLANDIRTLRYHESSGTRRGLYCNIGQCSECRVIVNDKKNTRACMTSLQEGMDVQSQASLQQLIEGD